MIKIEYNLTRSKKQLKTSVKIIIVVDDEDRETKVIFWQQPKSNSEMINFMATHGRGLICAPLTESRCKEWDYTSWSVIILIPWKLRLLFP
jgi:3,4-dihydroxy 2-butanone 4-phosphate synthase/GTP cyclohydrolase II